jgi:EAL domain-containing protein (putative c-di-GMP-specific phosphodiesterase class I)
VADIAKNRDEGFELPIAVNISVKDLIDPKLIPFIQKAVLTHQVPHHLLEIEITETSILENTELAIQRIHQLQHAGFNVAIDDFGTGHSSLAYLAHLPVSYIKIDPLFIREIHNERTGIIVKSIIELAAKIGVGLVAEGVEDIQALRVLQSLHCPIVQGFFLGKPMPRAIAVTSRINMGS